jgi:hypothetical protein
MPKESSIEEAGRSNCAARSRKKKKKIQLLPISVLNALQATLLTFVGTGAFSKDPMPASSGEPAVLQYCKTLTTWF